MVGAVPLTGVHVIVAVPVPVEMAFDTFDTRRTSPAATRAATATMTPPMNTRRKGLLAVA
jgi:hypothetical protein